MTDIVPEQHATPDPGATAYVGSFGLIRRYEGDAVRYLALDQAGVLNLVCGERLEGETFRESLEREIAWQLDLERGKDYLVSAVPRAHLNSRLCGRGGGEPRWYVVEFFVVNLYGKRWAEKITGRDDVVWMKPSELAAGGPAGLTFPDDVCELLRTADLVPRDEVAAESMGGSDA